jgi:hypothetical protein
MDPNVALAALLNAIDAEDVEAYWQALDDLHDASAQTGKLPIMPPGELSFTQDEMSAINTLCELELGSKVADRIEAWPHVDTAQDKILAVIAKHPQNLPAPA